MSDHDITHREIYERVVRLEQKVDALTTSTKDVTEAFAAAQGAFKVLETLSRLAKPLLWIGGLCVATAALWDGFKAR